MEKGRQGEASRFMRLRRNAAISLTLCLSVARSRAEKELSETEREMEVRIHWVDTDTLIAVLIQAKTLKKAIKAKGSQRML